MERRWKTTKITFDSERFQYDFLDTIGCDDFISKKTEYILDKKGSLIEITTENNDKKTSKYRTILKGELKDG